MPLKRTVTLSIRRPSKTPPVFLVASFTQPAWMPVELDATPLTTKHGSGVAEQPEDAEYDFSGQFEVSQGTHRYRFRAGSEDSWVCNEDVDTVVDEDGITNNVLTIESDSGAGSQNDNGDESTDHPSTEETLKVANSDDLSGDKPAENIEQRTKGEIDPEPNTSSATGHVSENEPTSDITATALPNPSTQQAPDAKEDTKQGLGESVESKEESEESNILATAESREAEPTEPAEPLKEEETTSHEAPVSDSPSTKLNGSQKPNTGESRAGESLEQQPPTEELVTPANDVKQGGELVEPQQQEESNPWNPASLPESPIEQEKKDEPCEQSKTQHETVLVQNDVTRETGELESNPWNPASLPESPAELAEDTELPETTTVEGNDKPPMDTHAKETEGTTAIEIPSADVNMPVKEPEMTQQQNKDTPSENAIAEKAEKPQPQPDELKDTSAKQPSPAVKEPVEVATPIAKDDQAPSPAVVDEPVEAASPIPEDNQAPSPAVVSGPVEATTPSVAEGNQAPGPQEEMSAKPGDVTSSTGSTTHPDVDIQPTEDISAAGPATKEDIQSTSAEGDTGPEEEEKRKDEKEVENKAVGAASEQQGLDDVMHQRSEEDRPEQLSSVDKVAHGPPEPSPDVKPQEAAERVDNNSTNDGSAPEIPVKSVTEPEPPVSEEKRPDTTEDAPTETGIAKEESASVPASGSEEPVASTKTEEPEKPSSGTDEPTQTKSIEHEAEAAAPTSAENAPAGRAGEENASVPVADAKESVTTTKTEQPEKPSAEADEPTQTEQIEHAVEESTPIETEEAEEDSALLSADTRETVASAKPEQPERPPSKTDEPTPTKPIEHETEISAPIGTVDKPSEVTTSVSEDQQTPPPVKESDFGGPAITVPKEQAPESGESSAVPSSEPAVEPKDDVLTKVEKPTAATKELEQEPTLENSPKDKSTPLLDTAAPAVPPDSYQTNGSTTIAAAQEAAPAVTTGKAQENAPQETSKQKGLPEQPSIPETAETKNVDVLPSTQQPKPVEAGVPATPPQPEIVVSHESPLKSDELEVNGQNTTASVTQRKPSRPSSSSAKPADDPSASVQEAEASSTEAPGREASHPATSSQSISSVPTQQKQGFFRALWQAVFVKFFGGLFAPFRRRKQHTE